MKVPEALKMVRGLIKIGRFKEASWEALRLYSEFKDDRIYNLYGVALLKLEEFERAREVFEDILSRHPIESSVLVNVATACQKAGDLKSTQRYLRSALDVVKDENTKNRLSKLLEDVESEIKEREAEEEREELKAELKEPEVEEMLEERVEEERVKVEEVEEEKVEGAEEVSVGEEAVKVEEIREGEGMEEIGELEDILKEAEEIKEEKEEVFEEVIKEEAKVEEVKEEERIEKPEEKPWNTLEGGRVLEIIVKYEPLVIRFDKVVSHTGGLRFSKEKMKFAGKTLKADFSKFFRVEGDGRIIASSDKHLFSMFEITGDEVLYIAEDKLFCLSGRVSFENGQIERRRAVLPVVRLEASEKAKVAAITQGKIMETSSDFAISVSVDKIVAFSESLRPEIQDDMIELKGEGRIIFET